jgi:hypothetical protein
MTDDNKQQQKPEISPEMMQLGEIVERIVLSDTAEARADALSNLSLLFHKAPSKIHVFAVSIIFQCGSLIIEDETKLNEYFAEWTVWAESELAERKKVKTLDLSSMSAESLQTDDCHADTIKGKQLAAVLDGLLDNKNLPREVEHAITAAFVSMMPGDDERSINAEVIAELLEKNAPAQ